MNYIKRNIEAVIEEYAGMFAVTAVTGPRQSGKSTTIKKIFGDEYRYFSMDDPGLRAAAGKDPVEFIRGIDDNCIIDEAQYVPDIFSAIKIAVDENPSRKGRFIITGSQQYLLMKTVTESLAGRVGLVDMFPLSAEELHKTGKFENYTPVFYDMCLKGGYPAPYLASKKESQEWYESYLRSYVERDVRTLYNIGKLSEFDSFVRILASRAGQILNLSSIASDLGTVVNTLKSWITILQASGIIYLLQPYHGNASKRLTKSPKVVFIDTGLLCHLNKITAKSDLLESRSFGSIFENFCVAETLKFIKNRKARADLYFLRNQSGLEIDLIIDVERKLVPIEIKSSAKVEASDASGIERAALLFRDMPIDRGYLLNLSGKSGELSEFSSFAGLNRYFGEILPGMIKG
jgi:predicted AAA+ superfamily ATPase